MSQPFITHCAWCPDKAARDAEAEARGQRVSHGICERCKAALLAALGTEIAPVSPPPVRFTCRAPAPTARHDLPAIVAGTRYRVTAGHPGPLA